MALPFRAPTSPYAPARIPTLDGARGLAALFVLIWHGVRNGMLPDIFCFELGTTGVDLFFILSGFLMAYLYCDLPFARREVSSYARHRIGRIVPLYLVLVLVSFVFYDQGGPVQLFPITDLPTLAHHLLFISGVLSLWTIPTEVQFYLVFLAIWFVASRGRLLLAVALPLVSAVLLTVLFHQYYLAGAKFFFWQPLFLLGGAIGILWRRHHVAGEKLRASRHGYWVGWGVLCAFVLFGLLGSTNDSLSHVVDPLLVAARAFMFFATALLGLGPMQWLALRPFRELGKISYGVYLFHVPVLLTIRGLFPPAGVWQGLLAFGGTCVVTLTFAAISYRWFEYPVRKLVAPMKNSSASRKPYPRTAAMSAGSVDETEATRGKSGT